jgi:hypothetical protein
MSAVCDRGQSRLRSWSNMLEKHRESYLRYLPEVLLLKEKECGSLLLSNWHMENEIACRLNPQAAELRKELETWNIRLVQAGKHDRKPAIVPSRNEQPDALIRRVDVLKQALDAAHQEIAALLHSQSWKITAPLRRCYDYWLYLKTPMDRTKTP